MTGNSFLLDTNIVIEIFNGNNEFAQRVAELSELFIPSIVLGELYVGINRVANNTEHLKRLNEFSKLSTVLDADSITALHYGAIMARLHKKGKPISYQ